MFEDALAAVENGQDLSFDAMVAVMNRIMQGDVAEEDVVRWLAALHAKGETDEEIAAAASVLRRYMTRIRAAQTTLIDTCGTGGDGSRTFNISTAAALVAAAAGVPVAKHGNRAATSRSGSADVLAALGVNIDASVACVEACLAELGICFCFAPLLHQAMRHVSAARRRLPHPTIFNVLGPLANPASAPYQLLGVGRPALREQMARALARLGARRAVVLHGSDGLDEVTLAGPTRVSEVCQDEIRELCWNPADFGLPTVGCESFVVDNAQQSAEIIRRLLAGERGPARDIVIANAAAALWTVGRAERLDACAALAAAAIDRGDAATLLARLAARSHAEPV